MSNAAPSPFPQPNATSLTTQTHTHKDATCIPSPFRNLETVCPEHFSPTLSLTEMKGVWNVVLVMVLGEEIREA